MDSCPVYYGRSPSHGGFPDCVWMSLVEFEKVLAFMFLKSCRILLEVLEFGCINIIYLPLARVDNVYMFIIWMIFNYQ